MPKPPNPSTPLLTEQLKAERIQQLLDWMVELGLSGIQRLPDRVCLTFLTSLDARSLPEQDLDPAAELEKVA